MNNSNNIHNGCGAAANNGNNSSRRVVAVGMVGAGKISVAHRIALGMDGLFALEAGAFSRSAVRSHQIAAELGVSRSYGSYAKMAEQEAARRASGQRAIELAVVVTHDALHYPVCKCLLQHGFHVVCDKPLTHDLNEAIELQQLARQHNRILAVTYNYSAYAMVREARARVLRGQLGDIYLAMAEHASSSLYQKSSAELAEKWRYRSDKAGLYGMVFDIGTHAHHLLRFITDLEVESLAATVQNLSQQAEIYDNALIQARLTGNAAAASIWVSRVATGHLHGLRIRVYGSEGSLEWQQEDPCHLYLRDKQAALLRLSQGSTQLDEQTQSLSRLAIGHPEGFFSSFANLYREVHQYLCNSASESLLFPQAADGIAAARFVAAVRASAENGGSWQTCEQ